MCPARMLGPQACLHSLDRLAKLPGESLAMSCALECPRLGQPGNLPAKILEMSSAVHPVMSLVQVMTLPSQGLHLHWVCLQLFALLGECPHSWDLGLLVACLAILPESLNMALQEAAMAT